MISISTILTFTTSPTDLTDAIERLLKPLTVFKISVGDLAVIMTIALRFIPTLMEELDKIMCAQKARGADLEKGSLLQKAKSLLPILIPLFISSFRRAYDLAIAMECRCYHGGNSRSRMKVLKMKTIDYVAVSIMAIFFTGVLMCSFRII